MNQSDKYNKGLSSPNSHIVPGLIGRNRHARLTQHMRESILDTPTQPPKGRMGETDMTMKYSFNKVSTDPDPALHSIVSHETDSHARHLCLVTAQGKRTFLNYSFLISGEYTHDPDSITLTFTTHSVTLTGHRLESLFNDLAAHKPKEITAIEERYAATIETAPHVTDITVKAI